MSAFVAFSLNSGWIAVKVIDRAIVLVVRRGFANEIHAEPALSKSFEDTVSCVVLEFVWVQFKEAAYRISGSLFDQVVDDSALLAFRVYLDERVRDAFDIKDIRERD